MKANNKPHFLKQLGKVCLIGIPVTVIIIIASIALMFFIDEDNVHDKIYSEYENLYQMDRIYDGSDYTKNDLFYRRMKEALLDFVERNKGIDTYATVTNYDGIVRTSSKESLRVFVMKVDADMGADYFCEDKSFIDWYKSVNGVYKEQENSSDAKEKVGLVFYINDAYLRNNGLIIPNNVIAEIGTWEYEYAKGDTTYHRFKKNYSDEYKYEGDVPFGAEYVVETFALKNIVPPEERYRLIYAFSLRGTTEESGIFDYVDGKGISKEVKKKLGDVEINLHSELLHGSDSLNVYARVNVFSQNSTRYAFVIIVELLFGILLIITIAIIDFYQKRALYEKEMYRINLMNSMAHDLKTPLAAMAGYAENLTDNIRTDKQDYYANAIKQNVEYMNGLIKNVLLLSKSETKNITLDRRPVNLIEMVNSQWEKYKPMAEDAGISIQINGESVINADESLMTSVIDNLLSNVLTYAKKDSLIEVNGSEKEFVITNHTDEIFENGIESLWEPFKKGNSARSDRNGSGLGLSIVKSICLLHNFTAKIKYENDMFTVTIKF